MEPLLAFSRFPETLVNSLSSSLGTQTDHVRLFLAILAGFPCALLYRFVISRFSRVICHLYFFFCGIGLITWNFGSDVKHSLINTTVVYLLLRYVKSPKIYVPIIFVFNMVYLVGGYMICNTTEYVVNWTMPHCVLCLRLIGLAFDVADGRKYDKLSEDQRETALRQRPSALEMFSYAFFVGGSLVGPQFPCKRYLDFVNGDLVPVQLEQYMPNCVLVALGRLCVSVICLMVFEILHMVFYVEYLSSESFKEWNIFVRALYITLWGYILLHQYLSVWLMSEGVCSACGLSYSGPTVAAVQSELDRSGPAGLDALVTRWKAASHGEVKDWYSACSNVHFRKFEFSASGVDVVGSFNLTTNRWAARYVFRRLRFLGSRSASHILTLVFLALWHGVYTGYYVCFGMEFLVVTAERLLNDFVDRFYPKLTPAIEQSSAFVRFLVWLVRKFIFQYAASSGLVAFVLLEFKLWYPIFQTMYFSGLLHLPIIVLLTLIQIVVPKRRSKQTGDTATATKTD